MRLRQIIDLFVAMGCEPQEIAGRDVEPNVPWTIRYLYCAVTEAWVSLDGFGMDEEIAPSVLDSWEFMLGTKIPRPNNFH